MNADVDHDGGKGDGHGDADQGPTHPRKKVKPVWFFDSDQQTDVHGQVQRGVRQTETDFKLK